MVIHYYKDNSGLWVRDAVGGVGVLVRAEVALNDKALALVRASAKHNGWGVCGTCEIKKG